MFFSFDKHVTNLEKTVIHLESRRRWVGVQGTYSFKYFSLFGTTSLISTSRQLYVFSDRQDTSKRDADVLHKRFEQALRGVKIGFSTAIRATGVGYKLDFDRIKQELVLKLGHSHIINKPVCRGMFFKRLNERSSVYLVYFDDKQKLNNFVAEVKSIRPVEPYKGKGLRYLNEIVQRKEGKKSNL